MSDPKPALSISRLNMLSRCGEQYRRRYIDGEIIPPAIAMLTGSAVDESVNRNLEHKIETEELLPAEQVADIARDALNHRWDESGVLLTPEEAKENLKKLRGEAVDKSVRLSLLHHGGLASRLDPTHVQRKWRIELDGYPFDLIGFIDIQESAVSVRDTKTSKKSPHTGIAGTDNQLTLYALAVQVLDGEPPEYVALDYLVDLKTPKIKSLISTRNDDDFRVILRRVENAIRTIEAGVFVPANQNDWACSERFCGYFRTCPYTRNPKSVSLVEMTA